MKAQETEALMMMLLWLHMDDGASTEAQETQAAPVAAHANADGAAVAAHANDGAAISMLPCQGDPGDEGAAALGDELSDAGTVFMLMMVYIRSCS